MAIELVCVVTDGGADCNGLRMTRRALVQVAGDLPGTALSLGFLPDKLVGVVARAWLDDQGALLATVRLQDSQDARGIARHADTLAIILSGYIDTDGEDRGGSVLVSGVRLPYLNVVPRFSAANRASRILEVRGLVDSEAGGDTTATR